MLAEHTQSFADSNSIVGYLVEHMRVGVGNMLKLDYREVPYVSTEQGQQVIDVGHHAAGHMVVTKYTLQQAKEQWDTDIEPKLAQFCLLARQLISNPAMLASYLAATDKDLWYQQHL